MEYLGDQIDIHGGGEDLIFPHHECEIAQAESVSGKAFARYWVHTRFLQVEGRKMAKRDGNFLTIRDLVGRPEEGGRGFDPAAVRLTLMSGQYRKPANFTFETLGASARHVQRIREARKLVEDRVGAVAKASAPEQDINRLDAIYDRALAAMLDDLNTPEAIAAGLEGVKLILGSADDMTVAHAASALAWLDNMEALLGWEGLPPPRASEADDDFAANVERLLQERTTARARRNFTRADEIRDQLTELGVEVMDAPEGPTWRRKS